MIENNNNKLVQGATEHSLALQQRIELLETKISCLEGFVVKILEKMKEVCEKYEKQH